MVQLDLFGSRDWELRKWIQDLDIEAMTPLDALIELNKLKEKVSSPP